MAIDYDTVMGLVIHENPGKDNANKTRGHFGSQLERKGESNVKVARDKKDDEIVIVYTDRSRSCFIPLAKGSRFKFNVKEQMHMPITVETSGESGSGEGKFTKEKMKEFVTLYANAGVLNAHKDMLVKAKVHMSPRTFNRRLALVVDAELLVAKVGGYEIP
jgi:hypothetical protein